MLGTTLKEMPEEDTQSSAERILTLDYARLVTVLWGTVKALSARVAQLEQQAPASSSRKRRNS